ncbi:MAG: efflux RND transporter periplasmic adaptor subunit [Alphaproteobacteria bacterium]
MNRSVIIAITFAIIIGLWLASGIIRDQGNVVAPAASISQQNAENVDRVTVQVQKSVARPQQRAMTFSGRTEASRTVHVLAETGARIIDLPFQKGDIVKKGGVLCRLAKQDREARMAEAQATMTLRQLEYEAAQSLAKKGHRSDTAVAAAKAQYDAAQALVKRMQVELDNTIIRAPFAGAIEDLPTEVGGYLAPGSVCAVLVEEDPFLVTAQLSEQEVGNVVVGAPARIKLVTGETITGTVRFVAKTAQQVTRTFEIEVEVANPNHTLREGITATMTLDGQPVPAHLVTAAALTLNDAGQIGVKTVDQEQRVVFVPTKIASETQNGVWLTGLPEQATIIVVGQEYVIEGEQINLVYVGDDNASATQRAATPNSDDAS